MTRPRRLADRIDREGLLALGTGGRMGSPSSESKNRHAGASESDVLPRSGPDALAPVYRAMTEAQLQRTIRAYLADHGYVVWVFPIMKRTMAGVPDLTFFHSTRPGRLYCWELKREYRYVVSEAQQHALLHLATVPGLDVRIVRPSGWPALRDALERGEI